jgi:hypothetical protein
MAWFGKKNKPEGHTSDSSDLSGLNAAFSAVISANQEQIKHDSQRLEMIVRQIATEIGEAPIAYNDNGEASVHPRLMQELRKRGNERLLELLRDAFRS